MEEKKYHPEDPFKDSKKKEKEKANWDIRPYLAVGLLTFLVFCLCVTVFFVFYRFDGAYAGWNKLTDVLQPIIIGMVIAYLLNPIMKFIEKHLNKLLKKCMTDEKRRKKLSRTIGTFFALAFFLLIIFLLIELVGPQLYDSVKGFITNLPDQVDNYVEKSKGFIHGDGKWENMLEETLVKASNYLENWFKQSFLPDIQTYITEFTSGIINVLHVLLNVFVGLIVAVYILLSKEKFVGQAKKVIYAILPANPANGVIKTVRKSNEIFGGFISGKVLDGAIMGVVCYIVLSIMHMPYTILVSVIVGVTNIIPFFGPFIGAVPGTLIIALADPVKGLYFIIFILIIHQLDGNIIGPKILSNSTGLTPFWVVFAIMVGGGLFGFAGMLLGVPVFAVIYYIIGNVIKFILGKRKLPLDTAAYIYAVEVDKDTNHVIYNEKYRQSMEETEEEKVSGTAFEAPKEKN